MYPEAYKDWIGIFNDDLLTVWQNERRELQKAAMLIIALKKELKEVETNLEVELINLQQQFKYKDNLEEKAKSLSPRSRNKSLQSINKENILDAIVSSQDTVSCTTKESPDLFKNINPNPNIQLEPSNTSFIDLSISDDEPIVGGSPTIKRRKRHHPRNKRISPPSSDSTKSKKTEKTPLNNIAQNFKVNLFKTPIPKSDEDLSIIENTPDVSCQKSGTLNKISGVSSKASWKSKRSANNTLTQMFGKCRRKVEGNNSKKIEDGADSDETYFEDNPEPERSRMGITEMLNYINEGESVINRGHSTEQHENRGDENLTYSELEVDSSQELDEFSKGGIYNEADVATPTDEPVKFIPISPEQVVRGKARKKLRGWACEKCKNFYSNMNLSPEELQKKMDECSRHRYKYQPPEETVPGFWDLSIPPENPD